MFDIQGMKLIDMSYCESESFTLVMVVGLLCAFLFMLGCYVIAVGNCEYNSKLFKIHLTSAIIGLIIFAVGVVHGFTYEKDHTYTVYSYYVEDIQSMCQIDTDVYEIIEFNNSILKIKEKN